MAMRVRVLRGKLVACCASKTKEKLGDLYIDDGVDHAIRMKIYNDYVEEGLIKGPKLYDQFSNPPAPVSPVSVER